MVAMNGGQSASDGVKACFFCHRSVPALLPFCPACGADLRAGWAATDTPRYASRTESKSTRPLPPLERVMSPSVPQDRRSPTPVVRRAIAGAAVGLVLLLLIALAVPNIGYLVPGGQTVNRVDQAAGGVLTPVAAAFGTIASPTSPAVATTFTTTAIASATAELAPTSPVVAATSSPTPTLVPTTAILSTLPTPVARAVLALLPSAVAGSPVSPPRAVVHVEYLNVRRDPSTRYPPLAVVMKGQTFDIVGRNAAGDWWQICCLADGRAGWVAAEMVTAEGGLEAVPVVPGE